MPNLQTKKDEEIGKDRIVYAIDPATTDMELVTLRSHEGVVERVDKDKPVPKLEIKFAEGNWKRRPTAIVK